MPRKSTKTIKTVKKTLRAGVLILKNVLAQQIILSHYLSPKKSTDVSETAVPESEEWTVSDLMHEKSKKAIYFLDSHKNQIKYWVNMIDFTSNGALPLTTSKPCWWCRSGFHSRPIGCPLRYNPHRESGLEKQRIEEKFLQANLPIETNDFFETEGIFCSFPCTKAYILSQRNSARYKDSATLLTLLFSVLTGKVMAIPPAASWKVLKDYGGHLTIQQFRATFGKLEFTETVNVRRPYMFSSSRYIAEKKIKLFRNF